ncbi:hypothetical protein ACIRSS_37510 [Amycolatopsis sp. NPDC101161]|uniref:hypothetical protein n=1 Tax=Amycolatopsis sp. NPDC101161 TaxID=3363940 RepID=UPI00381865D0
MSMTSAALANTHAVSPAFSTSSSRALGLCDGSFGARCFTGRRERFRPRELSAPGCYGQVSREVCWSVRLLYVVVE